MDILELNAFLAEKRIPSQNWGRDGSKSVQQLGKMLAEKECTLEDRDGVPWGVLHPLVIRISGWRPRGREHVALVEEKIARPGSANENSLPGRASLGVWIRAGEPPHMAALRALGTKLGLRVPSQFRHMLHEGELDDPVIDEKSFPGLPMEMHRRYYDFVMPIPLFEESYVYEPEQLLYSWVPFDERPWK